MIGHLKGTCLAITSEHAIIDVQGVGYEIAANARLLDGLRIGEAASLAIETMVREDFIRLIAFHDAHERDCFRLLQSVQGVGAKAALAILQILPPDPLLDAIAMGDNAALTRAQGIGKKIATRIVTELKGKVDPLISARGVVQFAPATNSKKSTATDPMPETGPANNIKRDAISALVNLGYDSAEVRIAVNRLTQSDPGLGVENLIRQGLKELSIL